MINWQPIETAPKDNKRPLYLAHFNDAGEMTEIDFNASWEAEQESWEIPQVYYIWVSEHGRVEEPTHWAYMDADPISDETIDRVLRTRVPGGSEVWHVVDGGGATINDAHRAIARRVIEAYVAVARSAS